MMVDKILILNMVLDNHHRIAYNNNHNMVIGGNIGDIGGDNETDHLRPRDTRLRDVPGW